MITVRPKPAVASGTPTQLVSATVYVCPATAQPGDLVYLEEIDHVELALAESQISMPCIGVVHSKPDLTHCTVQYAGEVNHYTGLLPDQAYYVSTIQAGKITPALPGSDMAGRVIQRIGTARNATTLLLTVDATDFVIL